MASNKQQKKRRFKVGDLVTANPNRRDLSGVGDGIVVEIVQQEIVPSYDDLSILCIEQSCRVFFAPRGAKLKPECRRWARNNLLVSRPYLEGIVILDKDLIYMKESYPEWLDPPDVEEISLSRFGEIMK